MTNDYGKDEAVVESEAGVTLLGGTTVLRADVDWALRRAPVLVAADGGAAWALAFGMMPRRVIGDMDSLSDRDARRIPQERLVRVAEQESTDFEKCLDRIRAPAVIGLGFLGGRVDHTLAALSCVARRGAPCLLVGPHDVAFAAPPQISLDLPEGCRLSLFPMAPVTGRSTGLAWPIDGLDLGPMARIGTSNRATGRVTLAFDGPGMVVLLPTAQRDAAWDALSSSGR